MLTGHLCAAPLPNRGIVLLISRIGLPTAASTCLPDPTGSPSDQLQEPYDPWRLCLSLSVGVHELGHTSGKCKC